jgi:hypothetical protein
MSFFWYYSVFSRSGENEVANPGNCWTTISKNLLEAALKLPRANDALYRGMKPPLEGVSFRTVKKDTWRSDAENPQAYDDPLHPPKYREASKGDDAVDDDPKIKPDFQKNRDLFLEGGSRGLSDVQPGDLFFPDKRISSYSSDPGTAMRYSSIEGQRYPSTVIIVEDGFGLHNQFTIGTCPEPASKKLLHLIPSACAVYIINIILFYFLFCSIQCARTSRRRASSVPR